MSALNPMPADGTADQRDQPFLYSWNRRLRHLHGISLRNVDITPPTGRLSSKTITEDDHVLKTPTRRLAQDERDSLQHSKSYDDLPRAERNLGYRKVVTSHEYPEPSTKRPVMGKLRRRSTMHWGAANPRERQQKLEDVALNRMVDVWFSLHHPEQDGPVYISEVMEKSMNPSFSFFDLDSTAASITRTDEFGIKIWTRNEHTIDYKLLLDLTVHLRSLQFVGRSLENFHHPLPQNCVLFHLSDGIYTSFTDLPALEVQEPQLRPAQRTLPEVNTSSYDALMKLANLADCIQDAIQIRRKLEADINLLLKDNKTIRASPEQLQLCQRRTESTEASLASERQQVEQLKRRKHEQQQSCNVRRAAMAEARQAQQNSVSIPGDREKQIEATRASIEKTCENSSGQIRRVCEDMLRIYPIEPIKNRALQFTIRSIHLPNSVFDDTNRDEIAAALGFTGQLVHYLALYLSIPLPYPIDAKSTNSWIEDPISVSLAQRRFPLHPTNVHYKFEYGVFLLNKDIEFLMNRSGLRVLDMRHTLPNLKYLLYVLTAGTGELPARKAGGVRGLWGGPITPSMSRRGSDDSVTSRASVDHTNGHAPAGKEKQNDLVDLVTGSGRVKGLPYRRSLLREAG